jgi:hypothetical protein
MKFGTCPSDRRDEGRMAIGALAVSHSVLIKICSDIRYRAADRCDRCLKALPADPESPGPVLGLPILLEAEEFIVLGGVLRVVGHDVHPLAAAYSHRPALEASASGNAS